MNRAISYWGMHALLRHEELVRSMPAAAPVRRRASGVRRRALARVLRLRRNRP